MEVACGSLDHFERSRSLELRHLPEVVACAGLVEVDHSQTCLQSIALKCKSICCNVRSRSESKTLCLCVDRIVCAEQMLVVCR